MDTDTLNDAAPRAELALPPGYVTGEFARAERALEGDLSHDRLLDLLLFADDREEGQHSHRELIDRNWDGLRNKIGAQLLRRMGGDHVAGTETSWRNGEVDWALRKFRLASDAIPDSSNPELIDLFLQAAENAYLTEGKPMQTRWDAVTRQCRAEILRRINKAEDRPSISPSISVTEDETAGDRIDLTFDTYDFDFVSMREALRAAENALRSDMSDAELFDLYVLVKEVATSEIGEVFGEIDAAVSGMILARMEAGLTNPVDRYPKGFDCPAHGEQALKALIEDSLTHEALLMLYRLGWDKYDTSGVWLAIADLSRAQILRRMTPLPVKPQSTDWEAWSRSELVRRLRLHRQNAGHVDSGASLIP